MLCYIFLCLLVIPLLNSESGDLIEKAPTANDGSKEQIRMKIRKNILFLDNAFKLDALLVYLQSNKTSSISPIKYQTNGIALLDKAHYYNSNSRNEQLANASEYILQNYQKIQQAKKGSCLLCYKQFKNSSYLQLHYATKHQNQLQGQNQAEGQFPRKSDDLIGQILKQPLYSQINQDQLNLLFQESVPPQQKFIFCNNLFARIQNMRNLSVLLRYKILNNQTAVNDLCIIIAFQMAQQDHWVALARWFSLFGILFITLFFLTYLYDTHHNFSNQQKKYKYKN